MSRTVAVVWHASFSIAAGVLYFFFVLPRWPELLGDTSHTLGTVLRIVTGALIGLGALPVVFTLLRARRPEFGTPQLALTLRTSSITLHVLAAALIIGTAIAEIWISLDSAGPWLFGIYAAAAAIALLGIFAFYLAFVAELPPPPPKPLKPKKAKQGRRGRRKEAAEDEATTEDEAEDSSQSEPAEVTAEATEPESSAEEPPSAAEEEPATDDDKVEDAPPDERPAQSTNGRLRNRRRGRVLGRVAVED
jgi:MFS family permease